MNATLLPLQTQEEITTSALLIATWKTAPCVRHPDRRIQIWKDGRHPEISHARKELSPERMKGLVHLHRDSGIQGVQALLREGHGTAVQGVPVRPAEALTAVDLVDHPHRPVQEGGHLQEVDLIENIKLG
jgi:hypothetical protein